MEVTRNMMETVDVDDDGIHCGECKRRDYYNCILFDCVLLYDKVFGGYLWARCDECLSVFGDITETNNNGRKSEAIPPEVE